MNDWTWAGVTTIQDGVPFSVYDSNAGTVFFQGGAPNADTIGPAQICPGVAPLTTGPIESTIRRLAQRKWLPEPERIC